MSDEVTGIEKHWAEIDEKFNTELLEEYAKRERLKAQEYSAITTKIRPELDRLKEIGYDLVPVSQNQLRSLYQGYSNVAQQMPSGLYPGSLLQSLVGSGIIS